MTNRKQVVKLTQLSLDCLTRLYSDNYSLVDLKMALEHSIRGANNGISKTLEALLNRGLVSVNAEVNESANPLVVLTDFGKQFAELARLVNKIEKPPRVYTSNRYLQNTAKQKCDILLAINSLGFALTRELALDTTQDRVSKIYRFLHDDGLAIRIRFRNSYLYALTPKGVKLANSIAIPTEELELLISRTNNHKSKKNREEILRYFKSEDKVVEAILKGEDILKTKKNSKPRVYTPKREEPVGLDHSEEVPDDICISKAAFIVLEEIADWDCASFSTLQRRLNRTEYKDKALIIGDMYQDGFITARTDNVKFDYESNPVFYLTEKGESLVEAYLKEG